MVGRETGKAAMHITEVTSGIRQDDVIGFVGKMIGIRTDRTVAPVVPLITDMMEQAGMDVEVYETAVPKTDGETQPVVLGTLRGRSEKPLLCFNGHMDVVPVEFPDKWDSPPFEPVVRDGKLYGRGACDMKGGLGAMIMAAKALRDSGTTLKGSLTVAAVPGEESGGWGTESMVKKKDWDAAVIGEPTEMSINPACNGITTFWVRITGKSSHASMPESGTNAIDKMTRVLTAFEAYREKLQTRTHPLTGKPAFVNCIINGGWRSVIGADKCNLHITTHLVPGETARQRLSEVRVILEDIKKNDPEFAYDILDWNDEPLTWPIPDSGPGRPKLDPTEISRDEPIVQSMIEASEAVRGKPLPIGGTRYACDSPFFVNDAKVPALAFGPGSIRQAHTYNEWVDTGDLLEAAKIYTACAMLFLGTV